MTRLLAVALLLIGTGCKSEVFEVPQCPSVSFSAGNVYGYQSPLTNGDSLTGEFPSHETQIYDFPVVIRGS